MVRPWLVEIYSDDRCSDGYAVYSDTDKEDLVEELIGTNEELMSDLIDYHIGEWSDEFDDEEEFEDTIGPHATYIPDDIWKDGVWIDVDYQKWFESLEIIHDERN